MATINKPLRIKDDLIIDQAPGRQMVIPVGTDSDRPGALGMPWEVEGPTTGTMRLNQDRGVVEIYNGSGWQSVAQAGDAVNASGAEEIALVQAIIFG
jgi:hypothetical protein